MANTQKTLHILFVDDDRMLQKFIQKALSRYGHQIQCAATYAEAEKLLQQHTYQLCIIDLALPDRSGLELFQWIRQTSTMKTLPVIIQSGFGGAYVKEVLALEPLACLQKPFDMEQLLEVIAEVK